MRKIFVVFIGILVFWVAVSLAISVTGLGYIGGSAPTFLEALTFNGVAQDMTRIMLCFAIPYALLVLGFSPKKAATLVGAAFILVIVFNAANSVLLNWQGFEFTETVMVFFMAPLMMGMFLPLFFAFVIAVFSLTYLNPKIEPTGHPMRLTSLVKA